MYDIIKRTKQQSQTLTNIKRVNFSMRQISRCTYTKKILIKKPHYVHIIKSSKASGARKKEMTFMVCNDELKKKY